MTTEVATETINAVGAIRVSSVKQGVEGDSPEAQKEQIERFASSRGFDIKKFFVFMESASKEQQPMQEAIDYCKDPQNNISHFIIKSIDRFTRGGSLPYDLLKSQLEESKVKLIDIYGIIGTDKINTLEHLGVEYKWSVYSPSKKSEILEAERSKDELRDIMTRMIGSQVRYSRLGYWVRNHPYGYLTQKVDTPHGKRTILVPHPIESKFIIKLFKLRATGQYTDSEIVKTLNDLGYTGRTQSRRFSTSVQPTSRVLLKPNYLWYLVRNPVYAGVNNEKWMNGKPIKFAFKGLVSIELFNKANHGRRVITRLKDGQLTITDNLKKRYSLKGHRSAEFPFKKVVLCPHCKGYLLGSSSRGKAGKYYPYYHCGKGKTHSFRVSKQELEDKIDYFFSQLQISPRHVDKVFQTLEKTWQRIEDQQKQELVQLDCQISGLEDEIQVDLSKIKVLGNASAIRYMEEEISSLEKQIVKLKARKAALGAKKSFDLARIKAKLKHLIEHLDEIGKQQMCEVKKARLFGLFFDKLPTYDKLDYRTPLNSISQGLNPLFSLNFTKHQTWLGG